jgi:hypothetical protein
MTSEHLIWQYEHNYFRGWVGGQHLSGEADALPVTFQTSRMVAPHVTRCPRFSSRKMPLIGYRNYIPCGVHFRLLSWSCGKFLSPLAGMRSRLESFACWFARSF